MGSILLRGIPFILGRTEKSAYCIVVKPMSEFVMEIEWWVGGHRLFKPGNHMGLQVRGIITVHSIPFFSELENKSVDSLGL